jgi:hypothetical protein
MIWKMREGENLLELDVDPRPEMTINEKLKEQIRDFQAFLTRDL